MCNRNRMRVIKKWQNEQIFFKAVNWTPAVPGVCLCRIRAEELGKPCGSLCEAKKEVMGENVAASPALSRARNLQAIQRVSLMVEGQNKRRRLKKREIVLFSSIVAGEAHTDCSGIAVIFKVTHTNPCSGGATWNLPSGGKLCYFKVFSTLISLSFPPSPNPIFKLTLSFSFTLTRECQMKLCSRLD